MADQEQRLLMLIDDEPAQSRLITALASREGWRTLVVGDAETAIATLGTREGMRKLAHCASASGPRPSGNSPKTASIVSAVAIARSATAPSRRTITANSRA